MVHSTVAVDPELRPERVKRTLTLDQNVLHLSARAHQRRRCTTAFLFLHSSPPSSASPPLHLLPCRLYAAPLRSSFSSTDFQFLRVSVSSFMDTLLLATRTLATFNDLSATTGGEALHKPSGEG